MHRNIWKLYLLNFLTGVIFWYPIEKLFFKQIGVTPFQVSINAVLFTAIVVLLDIPAGALADKWKRKYTTLLALVSLALASLAGALSHNLSQYIVSTLFYGFYMVLISGTMQALMYDSLCDTHHQNLYDKHQGRAYALFLAGIGVSSMAGGYISQWYGYRTAYIASAIATVCAIAVCLMLREPRSHKHIGDTNIVQHVRSVIGLIAGRQILLHLSLFIAAAAVLRSTQNEYAGLLFIALGFTAIPTGYANAAKWLSGSLGQIIAPRFGRKVLRFIPAFFVTFAIFSAMPTRWSLVAFYVAVFFHAILANQAEAEIQDHTPSEVRATALSMLSFSSNAALIPLGLLFGWMTQTSSVFQAYQMIAIFGMAYLATWALKGRRIIRAAMGKNAETVIVMPDRIQDAV